MRGKLAPLIFLLFSVSLFANGLNLNSLGSRAQAMGGAYVAIANDPSAVFWNPAGITQFEEKNLGLYFADIIPSGSYKFDLAGVDANFSKHYPDGLFAFYVPIGENLAAGLAVYTPSGLGTNWNGKDFVTLAGGKELEWMSKIGMVTISPVVAYKVSDALSIGVALNANYGMMELKTSANSAQYAEDSKGWGYGMTIGLLAKPSENFSMGLSFKTASKVSLSGDVTMEAMAYYSQLLGINIPTTSSFTRDITWPTWIAGGIAFKPVENLIISADVQWTQWSKEKVIVSDYKDNMWRLIFSQTPDKEEEMVLNWKDTTQLRFGAEYIISDMLAIRAGYYYDPSPAPDETMNVLLPSFNFNVITFGIGIKRESYNLDIGVEYLIGKERNVAQTADNMPGTYNMSIITPSVSFTYKF